MSTNYLKYYPDPRTRQRALSNYAWLARLKPQVRLPRLLPAEGEEYLCFEHIEGRHALPEHLPVLAPYLGGAHGAAYAEELHEARLREPYRTETGHTLPSFPDRRADAVARELRTGQIPGVRLTLDEAQELIMGADGPAAFYKDANPRNFLVTPAGDLVTIDFDDLTLAPFGYDLAKLVTTLAMTFGPISARDIAAALDAYNTAVARHCADLPGVSWGNFMTWAEVHHILTSRYAADGRYPHRWDQARPADGETGAPTWP